MKNKIDPLYFGPTFQCKADGRGCKVYPDGGTYKGKWFVGKKQGYGVFTFPSGGIYVGDWKDD